MTKLPKETLAIYLFTVIPTCITWTKVLHEKYPL